MELAVQLRSIPNDADENLPLSTLRLVYGMTLLSSVLTSWRPVLDRLNPAAFEVIRSISSSTDPTLSRGPSIINALGFRWSLLEKVVLTGTNPFLGCGDPVRLCGLAWLIRAGAIPTQTATIQAFMKDRSKWETAIDVGDGGEDVVRSVREWVRTKPGTVTFYSLTLQGKTPRTIPSPPRLPFVGTNT